MTRVVRAERIRDTRARVCEAGGGMATRKGQIFPPERRLWPLQGQKQTKVPRIASFSRLPPRRGRGSDEGGGGFL